MPQMAPLMWDLVMVFLLISFFFCFVLFYYNNTKDYKNLVFKKFNTLNYKW